MYTDIVISPPLRILSDIREDIALILPKVFRMIYGTIPSLSRPFNDPMRNLRTQWCYDADSFRHFEIEGSKFRHAQKNTGTEVPVFSAYLHKLKTSTLNVFKGLTVEFICFLV